MLRLGAKHSPETKVTANKLFEKYRHGFSLRGHICLIFYILSNKKTACTINDA